ncbi:hypothetical protein TREMEDRAFT_74076 [Tremella mesenterica DSM 1558]|uniref:uncharacterized protein n=1 Tax=Tremella mesenterica (strain ATCC 24925 / CBS 8224 / DSM 1558 / NBRC 9311 / NRRL Y-6157 / RJB 2259-6 / UBC 559-6) TaxID=578456 RepID=UPI0003F4A3B4|nr:uncharacterized protein TREMEDRAFT_74076 [Tremella mesenterica DSM 1558]EIW68520.1 hypothetical protein TREMEDRAFT_74076 [Tremella mesenterica DSM 1558]
MVKTTLPKLKSTAGSSTSALLEQVKPLESQLLVKPYNPNLLLSLLALGSKDDPRVVHKAIWALHRVFVVYIAEGLVGSIRGSLSFTRTVVAEDNDDREDESREVAVWTRDRLIEYVKLISGLLRDTEGSLRTSAVKLLFALLPPLSSSLSQIQEGAIVHLPYFRLLLDAFFNPVASPRGAAAGEVKQENQVELEDGVLSEDVISAIADYWAKYDDLRWIFFRETKRHLESQSIPHPGNLLAQLLPLKNLPTLPEHINAFYIPAFSQPPSKQPPQPKPVTSKEKKQPTSQPKKKVKKDSAVDTNPSWMDYYSSSDSDSSTENTVLGKRPRQRTSQLSIHPSIYSIPSHQLVYTSLWETVLTLSLDDGWVRKVLVGLHGEKGILGHMKAERRVRVADWLGALVDKGGVEGMLAMNGLYVLMTKYNLDYPQFYKRLYGMLDNEVLHVKYRARFFRLLDTFLASPLLPATMIASFIKRLAQLSLFSPPAGIIMIVPFIYNLFKRHPGCMIMIQRHELSELTDPYDPSEQSPFNSKAIDSSLWELAALQKHYLSSISTLSKVFGEVFTRPEYDLEDFIDHGYTTLFNTELSRKLRHAPAISFEMENDTLSSLFPSSKSMNPQVVSTDSMDPSSTPPTHDLSTNPTRSGEVVSTLWTF